MSCWRNDGASKENFHFDDQSKQVVFFFSSRNFLKEIENMFSVFLSNYRNTHESLGELEKGVETLASRLVFPQHFSFSQTSSRVSITQ
jgi:lipid A disaccharide synthetase